MWKGRAALLPAGLLVASVTALAAAQPAAAATISQSTASAINISALSVPLIPQSAAVNDGSSPIDTSSVQGAIPLLPGQTLANTGVYAQAASATDQSTSSACAGIVGSGAGLTLGADGTCNASTTSGPAIVNLPGFTVAGTGFSFRLEASSLYAVCTAGPSDGTTGFSASSTLANVKLIASTSVLGIPGPAVTIPIDLNQPLSIPAPFSSVISLGLNQVDSTGPTTGATALHIGLGPNSSIMSLDLGKVTCGQNAVKLASPVADPWIAGPTAAAMAGAATVVALRTRSRRRDADQAIHSAQAV
jgi:hypothetical protein